MESWIIAFVIAGADFSIEVLPKPELRAAYASKIECEKHLPTVKRSLGPLRAKVANLSSALSYVGMQSAVKMSEPRCIKVS
jgi:hypothetical protein